MVYLIIFIFGISAGSFLNCVIYRLESGGNFLKGRSFCPHCRHQLSWQDLIPVLSFFLLNGKCRYCGQKISWQYPLVEIATGSLFLLISNFQFPIFNQFSLFTFQLLNFFYLLTITVFLIVIFVFDLKHFIIPDKVIFPAILVSGLWSLVSGIFFSAYTKYEILNTIYSALGAALFFLLIFLISQGKWLGFGDVKLAFFMGLFLGYPNILVGLFFAFFLGAIIGVALIVNKKRTFKSEIPFGPFLVAGTFFALFWGKAIIDWYMNLLI